jgi:hypothetical protein
MSCAGHVPQILGPKNAWVFSKWADRYGPLYKLHVLDHFMLVLTDPASIMQLTRKGGEALLHYCSHASISVEQRPSGSSMLLRSSTVDASFGGTVTSLTYQPTTGHPKPAAAVQVWASGAAIMHAVNVG